MATLTVVSFLSSYLRDFTSVDCEGAGEMFRVTTLPTGSSASTTSNDDKSDKDSPRCKDEDDFFGKPTFLTVSGQVSRFIYHAVMLSTYILFS